MQGIRFWCQYLKIESYMKDKKYNKFLDFCYKNSVKYISEIDENLLRKYGNEDGVGPGRIKNIRLRLSEIFEDLENQKYYYKLINCKLKNLFYISKDFRELTIGDFLNFEEDEIKLLNISVSLLEKIYDVALNTKPIKEIIKRLEEQFTDDDIQLIIERMEQNKTLEEIGLKRGISRERTRQIEIKAKKIIENIFRMYHLNVALRIECDLKDEISLREVEEKFGKEKIYLVNFLKRNEIFSRPYYVEFLELFLYDKRESFFRIFYSLDLPEILTDLEVENLEKTFKRFKWIEIKEIYKIINVLGYKKHGKYFLRTNGYRNILEVFFIKEIDTPLRIDEYSIIEIINNINEKLDYNLYSEDLGELNSEGLNNLARRLEGLLSRIEGIIMTDSRTYIHIDKIKYDILEFIKIKDEIIKLKPQYIDSIAIYKTLETRLKEIGIFTDFMFYSLFKYNFSDELNLNTNGNSRVLTIGKQIFNRVEELEKFIKNNGKILEKSFIQDKLGYSTISLNNAIDNSKKIISFDRSTIGLIDFIIITKDELICLKKDIEKYSEEGYISIPEFISKIRLDKKYKKFIRKNKINKYFIASYIRYLFPEYKGGCNLLSKK
ncbi:sigma factor-like helix-turn-helix DNA-binding protein [Cetobacterium ceti]